jgi:RNA polymerase sigma-70 factor (ECF subfamily)
METDAELVSAVLRGRKAAFGELLGRYERLVRAAARSVLRDDHAVEDAVQETFLAAYRGIGALRDGSAFGGWVLRIARREAIRLGRREARHAAAELPPDAPASGDGHLDGESRRLLDEVLALPDHERVVLMMRYFEGRGVREIAEMLSRPIGTVTKQLSRAYQRLQGRLAEQEP